MTNFDRALAAVRDLDEAPVRARLKEIHRRMIDAGEDSLPFHIPKGITLSRDDGHPGLAVDAFVLRRKGKEVEFQIPGFGTLVGLKQIGELSLFVLFDDEESET